MRILFVSDNFPPYSYGGANISTSLVVKELSKNNKCFVLTQNFKKQPWKFEGVNVFPLLKEYSPNFLSLKTIIKTGFQNIFSYTNKRIIKNFIKENKIDVIQLQTNNLSLMKDIISLNFPLVIDIRDTSLVCPIMFRQYPCIKNCNKCLNNYFKQKYNHVKGFKIVLPIFVKSLLLNNKKQVKDIRNKIRKQNNVRVISLSNYIKNLLVSNKFDRNKITTIYNISEVLEIKKQKKKNQIVFAGFIEHAKGIWTIIKCQKFLKNKIKFLIAGDGPELNEVKKYIKTNKIINIKLLGKITNKEVSKLYLESKIVLGPSILPEAFGRFIQESRTVQTPCIASKVGGIPEGIKHKKTGFLVEPNDPRQLAKAINELLTNKKLYEKIVCNLKKEQKKYSPEVIGKQRLDLYKKFLKQNEIKSKK